MMSSLFMSLLTPLGPVSTSARVAFRCGGPPPRIGGDGQSACQNNISALARAWREGSEPWRSVLTAAARHRVPWARPVPLSGPALRDAVPSHLRVEGGPAKAQHERRSLLVPVRGLERPDDRHALDLLERSGRRRLGPVL